MSYFRGILRNMGLFVSTKVQISSFSDVEGQHPQGYFIVALDSNPQSPWEWLQSGLLFITHLQFWLIWVYFYCFLLPLLTDCGDINRNHFHWHDVTFLLKPGSFPSVNGWGCHLRGGLCQKPQSYFNTPHSPWLYAIHHLILFSSEVVTHVALLVSSYCRFPSILSIL